MNDSVLAGRAVPSRAVVHEILDESLGLGISFVSERDDRKEAANRSIAAGAVSERTTIQTAAVNSTRHSLVTASDGP